MTAFRWPAVGGGRRWRGIIAGKNTGMAFISNAESVTVLIVDADRHPRRHGSEPGSDIATYLARHNTDVVVDRIASDGSPVAEAILEEGSAWPHPCHLSSPESFVRTRSAGRSPTGCRFWNDC